MKKGSWVMRIADDTQAPQIGQVVGLFTLRGEDAGDYLNICLYGPDGARLGRVSPPMGGPRDFEPACPVSNWVEIEHPTFPLGQTTFERHSGYRKYLKVI